LMAFECGFCEGTGKCEECQGTGTNPHFNSEVPTCPHCSGTKLCPECEGTGKSPLGRPRKGNILIYGLAVSAALIGLFGVIGIVANRVSMVLALVIWWGFLGFLYVIFYRNARRKKPSPPSRF